MYQYIPQNICVGDDVVVLITAVNPFNPSDTTSPYLLGMYDSEAEATAAYYTWCDEIQGTGAWGNDPWAGLALQVLPCGMENVPALVEAARTGQAVYVGYGEMFSEEQVMTGDGLEARITSFTATEGWERKDGQTGRRRRMTSGEIDVYVRKFIQRISEDVLQILR